MYSLLFTIGLRYNRLATRNFVLTYAVLSKLRTKKPRKLTMLKQIKITNSTTAIFPKLFSPKEKIWRTWKVVWLELLNQREKQRSQNMERLEERLKKTALSRPAPKRPWTTGEMFFQNTSKNAREKVTKVRGSLNATYPIWRVLASTLGISSWTPLKPQHSNPKPNPWPINSGVLTSLLLPHRLHAFFESLMLLKKWCSIYARWFKSSLKHSIRFCGIFS